MRGNMDIELMILGFLMSGPKTGYRLKAISGKLFMFYSITLNKIYPVLRKLEGGGYIKKEIVFQTGKPNKHLYSLTDSGKEYFFEKLREPPVPLDMANPFFIKSFFFFYQLVYFKVINDLMVSHRSESKVTCYKRIRIFKSKKDFPINTNNSL